MSMYALDNQLNYYRLECEKLKQENERISSDLAIAEKFIEAKDRILDQIQQENARLREQNEKLVKILKENNINEY